MVRRHAYLLLKSWPRLVSTMYYPTVTMILWAFITVYLRPTASFLNDAPGFFIGAVLLWDVLYRGSSACRSRSSRRCTRAISATCS